MARSISPLLLLSLAAPAPALQGAGQSGATPGGKTSQTRFAQLTIRERVVIRVPRVTPSSAAPVGRSPLPPAKPVAWRETKGPKCIAAQGMAGAMITAPKQVDLVLIGGKRVRVKLDGDCKQLDYYRGFYLRPSDDGMICADRDSIKMRSGASCGIDSFKTLVAK